MKGNVLPVIGAIIFLAILLGASSQKTFLRATIMPYSDIGGSWCSYDASVSFTGTPDGILVTLQEFSGVTSTVMRQFETKTYTPATLKADLVTFIQTYCKEGDYCNSADGQVARSAHPDVVALSASHFVDDNGVYYNNLRVLKANQQFKVIISNLHSDITGGSDLAYNKRYIGGLYGVSDADTLKCMPGYGLSTSTPTTTIISPTTTLPSSSTPTTTVTTTTNVGGPTGNPSATTTTTIPTFNLNFTDIAKGVSDVSGTETSNGDTLIIIGLIAMIVIVTIIA